ncbi:MAG: hypothetical protein H0T10_01560 [Actinobacteria bacterium]|nr:hypothetical protein [Actinomycetota bacterium]
MLVNGQEILELAESMEQIHPDLFHQVPRTRFRAEVEDLAADAADLSRDELVARLMRLAALPGERDGHTGIFPFDQHAKPLHVYPLRLYDFGGGLYVVGSISGQHLTGRRVSAIAGRPIQEVVELVRPLVPHDNESGRRWLLPEYVVTAEVLRGLDIVKTRTASFSFADGTEAELTPVPAEQVAGTLGGAPAPLPTRHDPVWLRHLEDDQWLTTLQGGRAVYLGYRLTTGATSNVARRLLRLASRPAVRRVIVDVRLNHGGDNTTFGPLVDVLRRPVVGRKLVVLTGRSTFSAAGNFVGDVDRYTKARFVGEPAGGAPSQWGDSSSLPLRLAGVTVHVANAYWEFGPRNDKRLAVEPDVAVEPLPTSSPAAIPCSPERWRSADRIAARASKTACAPVS